MRPALSQPTTCEGLVSVDFDSCNMWRPAQSGYKVVWEGGKRVELYIYVATTYGLLCGCYIGIEEWDKLVLNCVTVTCEGLLSLVTKGISKGVKEM